MNVFRSFTRVKVLNRHCKNTSKSCIENVTKYKYNQEKVLKVLQVKERILAPEIVVLLYVISLDYY